MEIKVISQNNDTNENCHKEIQNILNENHVYMINLMGASGSGKTTFILNMLKEFKIRNYKVAVILADIDGDVDAEKIAKENIPTVQLNIGDTCHINSMSIKNILYDLDMLDLDIIIVENIGELGYTPEFDIGEHLKVYMLSVPEGSDKIVEYPLMFKKSDALVLSKTDLINNFDFNIKTVFKEVLAINENIKLFNANSKNEEEVKTFVNYIEDRIKYTI